MVDLDAIRARAEAAISALSDGKSACAECPDYGEPNGCNRHGGPCDAYDVCQDAAEVVEALLEEVERLREALKGAQVIANQAGQIIRDARWIPVSERFPDGQQAVLIWFDRCGGDIDFGYWSKDKNAWFRGGMMLCYNVTHWMPLPKPPNTEGKED